MKRLNQSTVIFYLLTLYAAYTAAKSHKDIHHLLTSDEREEIFGHPFVENVPEYDICHPVQVDTSGNFLSHDLMNGNSRRKRDVGGSLKEPVFFKLSAFGDEFHLNVSLNDELFSSNFEIEIRGNGTREFHYDIEHCHYIGELLPAKGNKVAVSNCDGLKGLIRTPQAVLMVNPLPDRLGLGKNKSRAHVIHRRSATPLGTLEEAMDLDKRSDSWCGVEADPSSWQNLEEEDEHMNFPRSAKNKPSTIESMIVIEKVMTKAYGVDQIKKYVPTIVNMAHGLLDDASIGADIKYIIHKLLILEEDMPGLVISNHAASTLSNFCKWTTGQNIADDNNPAHFDHAALISKYNFCRNKRQAKAKAEGCGDILGLADLQGMCKQDTSCTLNKDTGLGTAFTLAHETAHNLGAEHDAEGNKCKNGVNIMATRAAGKVTAFDWSPCSRKYVTSFLQTVQAQCLRDKAKNKVKIPKGLPGKLYDGNDQCVRMFGAGSRVCSFNNEKMCVNLYCELPDGSGYCNSNDEPAADGTKCGPKKWCRRGSCVAVGTKGYEDVDGQWGAWSGWEPCYPSCGGGVSKRVRECDNPAPKRAGKLCEGKGTEYKYCKQQKCPPRFEKPRMTQCKSKRNVEFARGQTYKWIFDPYYAGKDTKTCVLSCATAGGDVSSFGNLKDGTSCSKGVCINDGKCEAVGCDGSIGSRAKVDRCGVCNGDGSTCGGGGGGGGGKTPAPKPKPKPTRPSEPPTEKPSSGGKLRKFTYSQVPGYDYYQDIATLPVGARKIRIEEVTPSENSLMLDTPDGYNLLDYDTYYADYGPAKFQGAGTTFLLKKKNNKEVITAEGPLTEKLKLVYEAVIEGVKYTVKYQYVAPGAQSDWGLESDLPEIFGELSELNKQLDDAENEGEELEEELNSFTWMKSAAEECSVSCGGGTDTTTYVCVRVDDESPVGDQFCKEERPEDEIKDCNTQRCPARWMIGFWTECSKSCNDGSHGMRTREVFCVEDSQGIELELKENECKKPKPITQEVCGQQACPAEWDTVQVGPCSTSCGPGVQPLTVKCIKTNTSGESEPTDEKDCTDIKPPTHVTCNVENPCEA